MGQLQLSYDKQLSTIQIAEIESSLKKYLKSINNLLNIDNKYEIIWLSSSNLTEFKVYDIPSKVGNLMINQIESLAKKF